MWTRWAPSAPRQEAIGELKLVDRLAQALLLYTLEHESASEVPLTMAANLVRVIGDEGARDRATWCGAPGSPRKRWHSSPAGANAHD